MTIDKKYADIYDQLSKRKNKFRNGKKLVDIFTGIGLIGFIFSVIPIIPAIILVILGMSTGNTISVPIWFVCIFFFGSMMFVAQRYSHEIIRKIGFSLEEEMYLLSYESLVRLLDYVDKRSSRTKRKVQLKIKELVDLLENVNFPYMQLIKSDSDAYIYLVDNVVSRLVPSISQIDKMDSNQLINAIKKLLDFAATPVFVNLSYANSALLTLPLPEKTIGKIGIFRITVVRYKSNIRHLIVLALSLIVSYVIYQFDIILGAKPHEAFGIAFSAIALVVMGYLAILNLTSKRLK